MVVGVATGYIAPGRANGAARLHACDQTNAGFVGRTWWSGRSANARTCATAPMWEGARGVAAGVETTDSTARPVVGGCAFVFLLGIARLTCIG